MKKARTKNSIIRLLSFTICLTMLLTLSACGGAEYYFSDFSENSADMSGVTSVISSNQSYRGELAGSNDCVIPVKDATNLSDDFKLNSSGALLVDITKNKLISSKNIYEKLYPASLTKLATAFVCLKYGNLDDDVTVSYTAAHLNTPGAKLCYLSEGDVVNFKVLLTSFIVYSGNDAGVALAEHISGTEGEFVKLMNKELKKIGAVDTNFVNSHGLPDDNHYTSVYDMYLIMNELLKYDTFNEIAAIDSYKAEFKDASGKPVSKVYENTNRYLIGEKELPANVTILASKTGTTFAAGSCLALTVSGKKGHNYIAILMKAGSSDILYDEMTKLLKQVS